MNRIQLLDKQTIDKIAAGEVIDRPSSIVKELVENSMDAGATAISIEIQDGGKQLIRVTDNGSGIPKDQTAIAFARHSTSKIRMADDLSFIHSFGFRGEALSSIAAVSRTELCTKTRDSLTGTIYRVEGGEEVSITEAGLPDGTTVIVRDLFYNTPARLKFLKSSPTEAGYIQDLVQRLALSHPEISFKYSSNGTVKISTSGNGSLEDVIYSLFGRDISRNMLDLSSENENISIQGFLGKPEIARGNRGFEFYFVNGRYVKDRIIQQALEEAYIGYQMKGTYPFAVLLITMEPELVDVNVHPSKLEVRFYNEQTVFQILYDSIRRRIARREDIFAQELVKEPAVTPEKTVKPYVPEPFEAKYLQKEIRKEEPEAETPQLQEEIRYQPVQEIRTVQESQPEKEPEPVQETIFLSEQSRPGHKLIGAVFDTYWIVEYEDKLFIIDQHAAHEKVLYERFIRRLQEDNHFSQQILPAQVLSLSSGDMELLQRYQEVFIRTGFEIEFFGGNEIRIKAVPTDFYSLDCKVLLLDMLEDLKDTSSQAGAQVLRDRVATAACKAAVKGGNRLSYTEANTMIDELLKLDNPYHCPHGRPTIISISRYELEKRFKRNI